MAWRLSGCTQVCSASWTGTPEGAQADSSPTKTTTMETWPARCVSLLGLASWPPALLR